MKVQTLIVSEIQENTYIYFDENTKDGVIIDPGGEENRVMKFINDNGITIHAILITHGHFDHIMAINHILKYIKCDVVASRMELQLLSDSSKNLSKQMLGLDIVVNPNIILDDGETYTFGNSELKIISTPGHTPGGACYYSKKNKLVFTGDTLFYKFIGRTDLYMGSETDLISNIKNKLFTLPDDVKVYCGHGMTTSIGFEKSNNEIVRP